MADITNFFWTDKVGGVDFVNADDANDIADTIKNIISALAENGALNQLNTSDKTNIVNAINSIVDVGGNIKPSKMGAVSTNKISDGAVTLAKLGQNVISKFNSIENLNAQQTQLIQQLQTAVDSLNTQIEQALNAKIGDLAQLKTTDKSNIVNAINYTFDYVNEVYNELDDTKVDNSRISDSYDPTENDLIPNMAALFKLQTGFLDTVAELYNSIGYLSDLTTQTKSNLVGAVNEVNQNKVDKTSLSHETWTFEFEDGTTEDKEVVLWSE